MGKMSTFISLLLNKIALKYFWLKTRSFKFIKELKLSSILKQSNITCLEYQTIKTEMHALMSHPIRVLCPDILQYEVF